MLGFVQALSLFPMYVTHWLKYCHHLILDIFQEQSAWGVIATMIYEPISPLVYICFCQLFKKKQFLLSHFTYICRKMLFWILWSTKRNFWHNLVDSENGPLAYFAFSDDILMLFFSPEILASFSAQHIYVISADILALFHPELPAESTAFWFFSFFRIYS